MIFIFITPKTEKLYFAKKHKVAEITLIKIGNILSRNQFVMCYQFALHELVVSAVKYD